MELSASCSQFCNRNVSSEDLCAGVHAAAGHLWLQRHEGPHRRPGQVCLDTLVAIAAARQGADRPNAMHSELDVVPKVDCREPRNCL